MVKYSDPIDLTFYSLSHPVRRELLRLVAQKDHLVTQLAAHFDMSLAAISKHLKILEKASLISRRKEGRNHLIGLSEDGLLSAEQWLQEYREFWSARFDGLEKYLKDTEGDKDEH